MKRSTIKIYPKSRVKDSVIDDLNKTNFVDIDVNDLKAVKDWVELYIVPLIQSITGKKPTVSIINDEQVEISNTTEEAVNDAFNVIASKSKVGKGIIRKLIKDDEFESCTKPVTLQVEEDMTPEQTNSWLKMFAGPAIKSFLEEHGVPVEVDNSVDGVLTFKSVGNSTREEIVAAVDSFVSQGICKLKVTDAEDEEITEQTEETSEEKTEQEDPEEDQLEEEKKEEQAAQKLKDLGSENEEEEVLNSETFAQNIAIPAISAHLEESGYKTDLSVRAESDKIVIYADMEGEIESVSEVADACFLKIKDLNKSPKSVKVVFKSINDSKKSIRVIPSTSKV